MTDDLTHDHLRALLAEQTAQAERAEVDYRRVLSERAAANQLAGRCAQQRDHALAACAEMRAAIDAFIDGTECLCCGGFPWCLHDQDKRHDLSDALKALLARPDRGAGKMLVEREVVRLCRDTILEFAPGLIGLIADLDALLKKGGG